MLEQNLFNFYKEYLKGLAFVKGRPYKEPKTLDSLYKREGEKKLFFKIVTLLRQSEIQERKSYKKFIDVCLYMLKEEEYHVSLMINDFEKLMRRYDNFNDIYKDEKESIVKSMAFLEEYCIINEFKEHKDIMQGNPPPIVRLWKQKKIDTYTFVYIFDISSIAKKRWAKIYLGTLNCNKAKNIKKKLIDNQVLHAIMQQEKNRFDRLFKEMSSNG